MGLHGKKQAIFPPLDLAFAAMPMLGMRVRRAACAWIAEIVWSSGMQCLALDKAMIGLRELWMTCRLERGHEGHHNDPKRASHFWKETFYAFEFEYGRPVRIAMKRKVRICKKCGKQVRTDGGPDSCVCKEIGANKRQSILFAEEREKACREAASMDIGRDFDWLMADSDRRRESDGYHGAW